MEGTQLRETSGDPVLDRRAGCVVGLVVLVGVASGLSGCAKPKVSDLDAYQVIPMNRVVPYPDEKELGKRVFEVAVVDRPSLEIDEATLRKPRAQVRKGLEKTAAAYGAAVIEPSRPGFEGLRTDRSDSGLEGDVEVVPSGDYAISARFTTYQHRAVWSKPAKWPWQAEADVAKKPGTCTHTAAIAFDVQLVEKSWEDVVQKTYLLSHHAKQENKDLDQACTISPANVDTMFETAVAEALDCLDLPLGTRVSPRGHVLAHRKAREGEGHIYQISLGADQGVDAGEPIEIRRVDRSEDAEGHTILTDRVIASGVATDQITAQDTWVAIDVDDVKSEILEGDVVKRVFSKGLINDLSGPDCKAILVER
jgi:hypothetical protein